jgi:[SSU ribosomal protein S18P]-alanine acetyltransferase (EC 2.3.1.128)
MTLRAAEAADLVAIMDLERASFPTDAWSEPMMAAEIASPHGRYLVDVEGGRVVGYGGVRAVQGAADADIQTIAIAETSRGHGRGRALLRALIGTARERGARDLFLEVRDDNPAAFALYASEGFTEVGRRPRYYQPDDVDAVVMKLDLPAWAGAQDPAARAGVCS